jgi:hypothetical protein
MTAAFYAMVAAQPDCVRCGGKCHQFGYRQLCHWCCSDRTAHVTWHWHDGQRFKVRAWMRSEDAHY